MKKILDEWVVGQEYEFSDCGSEWVKRELLVVLPENYEYRFIVKSKTTRNDWVSYIEIRHIKQPNPNQEILDQIAVLENDLSILKSKIK